MSDMAREVAVALEALETDWEFAGGKKVRGWTFNGQVPGPTIEANAGDTVVARLTNRLTEPTPIHWHGIRLVPPMDGTEFTQRPVAPGETFEYRYTVPDAGTFWYHPHTNETEQLERGLYGALIVRGPGEPQADRERVLVLDDLRLNWRGQIARFGGWLERHNGREGKIPILNGRADTVVEMAAGLVERWRLINSASARYMQISVGRRPFRLIGTDGGLLEAPVEMSDILLAPGDRAELLVGPFATDEELAIEARPYNRGLGLTKPMRFGMVRVGAAEQSVASVPARLRVIEPLASPQAPVTREVKLSGRMSWRRGVDFMVNDEPHHHDRPVKVGELQVWEVVNATPIDHPFHLHGFFFQVLAVNGAPPPFRSWEDTVNVPAKGRVKIVWKPDDRPGLWMYHCHILEHHAAGMMGHFEVVR